MQGSNFKYFRRNEKLKEMTEKYYKMSDKAFELYQIARETDNLDDWLAYEEYGERKRRYGDNIWCTAFYTLGRTNEVANDYCRAHSIDY